MLDAVKPNLADLVTTDLQRTGDISGGVAVFVPSVLATTPTPDLMFGLPRQDLIIYIAIAGLIVSFVSHLASFLTNLFALRQNSNSNNQEDEGDQL